MKEHLMVQQQVKSKWQHMVGVICLNQVNRRQTKPVLTKLFKKYPTPHSLLRGCTIPMLTEILKPLYISTFLRQLEGQVENIVSFVNKFQSEVFLNLTVIVRKQNHDSF